MCDRTCPECGSNEHSLSYGVIGTYIICNDCCTILANAPDPEAANTNLSESEVKAWVKANSFVLPGAEAKDPKDDLLFLGGA